MPATAPVYYGKSQFYHSCTEELALYDSSEDAHEDWGDGGAAEPGGGNGGAEDGNEVDLGLTTRPPMATQPTTTAIGATSSEVSPEMVALAKVNHLRHALDSYTTRLRTRTEDRLDFVPLAASVVDYIVARRAQLRPQDGGLGLGGWVDGLSCPICEGVLRYPVTATCGHTFCRQCCFWHSSCTVCGQRFPSVATDLATICTPTSTASSSSAAMAVSDTLEAASYGQLLNDSLTTSRYAGRRPRRSSAPGARFEQDILIRRLVERWWAPELKAADLQEEARRHLEANSLDEALRCCNQSLEHAPNSAKGLQLRSEVLFRLQHYQSALADADGAARCHPLSHKAYHCRALSLSALRKTEDAIVARCISIFLDRQSVGVIDDIQTELIQDLQQLLAEPARPASTNALQPERPTNGSIPTEEDDSDPDPLATIFDSSYDLIAGCRKRRHRALIAPQKRKAKRKQFVTLRQGDFDEDHSDYGDGEDYLRPGLLFDYMDDPFCEETALLEPTRVNRQHRSHHRRRRKSGAALLLGLEQDPGHLRDHRYHQQQQEQLTTIPKAGQRLRSLLERIDGELEAIRWSDSTPVRLPVNPALIEASDFDCVLCCRTLWRPVVTPCGHTYCWVCLDRCMDYSSSCPLCKAPLVEQFQHHVANNGQPGVPERVAQPDGGSSTPPANLISLAMRKMTAFVDLAMRRFIPEAYERRQQQEQDREPTVPVFICTTAFPSVPCPLFVREQRYRLMVRRAIESGERQFGIALPTQTNRQRYEEYGTMLDIRDCVQLGDGCSILSTVGGRRFRVLARHEKDGYDTASVEFFEDEKIAPGPGSDGSDGAEGADERLQLVRELHEKVLLKAIDWHQSLAESTRWKIFQSFGKMPDLEENWEDVADGPAWAWWIIAILRLNDKIKVGLLSTTSLEKRLRAIDKTLNLEKRDGAWAQQKRGGVMAVAAAAAASSAACCEGLSSAQQCQVIDCCCVRERTTSSVHNHHDAEQQSVSNQHHHHQHLHHHLSSAADEYLL
ncbi:uncharacterized protein LOC128267717 [Anopheles cruzii]|uniref:uncharacterized protein LOC128267717 n=1 Tax=Anopheles cruzii TaxID=68878 RepID=UPI0022EC970D|nr:uncharacterized protein LOC128267717 [Anopheles cruzii]